MRTRRAIAGPSINLGDPINRGLVAYYTFDTNTVRGGTVRDLSPSRITATLGNSPSLAKGRASGGLLFNGSSQYGTIGTGAAIPLNAPVTVSCWALAPFGGTDNALVSRWRGLTAAWSWILQANVFACANSSGNVYTASVTAPTSGWHHFVGTMNVNNNISFYLDGVQTTGSSAGFGRFATDGVTYFGGRDIGDTPLYTGTTLDDIRIYNRSLTQREARRLFTETQPPPGLVPPYRIRPLIVPSSNTTFSPGAGAETVTGQTPTLKIGVTKAPGAGTVTVGGQTPTLTSGMTKAPGAGAATVTGYAPTLSNNTAFAPGAGAATVAGQAPTLTFDVVKVPGAGTATITGYTPTLVNAGTVTFAPGAGRLTIQGGTPILTGAVPIITGGPGDGDTAADIARRKWLEWLKTRKKGATSPVPDVPPAPEPAKPGRTRQNPAKPGKTEQPPPNPLLLSNIAAMRAQSEAIEAHEKQRAAVREAAAKLAAEIKRRRDEDDDDVLSLLL